MHCELASSFEVVSSATPEVVRKVKTADDTDTLN
jgi:hypothetical protein